MKFRRFIAVVFVIALISAIPLSANAQTLSAIDTEFKFSFGVGGTENMDLNGSRAKENDSSCYINYKSGPAALRVKVWGTNRSGVIERDGNWYPDVHDCMTGYYAPPSVRVGQKGFIRQRVFENGYPYAIMSGRCSSHMAKCTGLWSPDSVSEAGAGLLN